MSTSSINNKSQQINARVPHDVIEGMASVKNDGESNANFIVTAIRGEIARRQLSGGAESAILLAREALTRIEEIGAKAGEDIQQLVSVARTELQRRTPKSDATED